MKRFFLGLFCVFISAFAFAQTAVNQGKNFVVYSCVDFESFDWYESLDQINVKTADENPATVSVRLSLGYKKSNKAACTEIANRRIEIVDMLRRFFSEQTANDFKPQNEENLRKNIKDKLNKTIFNEPIITDVLFTQLDVIQSY